MEARKTTSLRQLELLINYMEGHRDFALGRVRTKEARADAAILWSECAELLNPHGPTRTAKQWSKVWNDFKTKVRGKLFNNNSNQTATCGGPNWATVLSPIEERVAKLLDRHFETLLNVSQDQFVINDDQIEEIFEVEVEDSDFANTLPPVIIQECDRIEQHVAASPLPSRNGQTPIHSAFSLRRHNLRGPVKRRRRKRQASSNKKNTLASAPAQSSRSSLEASRRMILRIEELRAEAALNNSEAANMIARSIDRFSEMFCQQPDRND